MGRLVLVKCDCGFEYDRYHFGVNMAYPEVKKHQTALVKSGRYGKQWQSLLASDSELKVDAQLFLYQCPKCHLIFSEPTLDLYKSKKEDCYYTPSPDEIIYYYKHICPNCKKLMKHIPLYQERIFEKRSNEEELVICPKCGGVAIAEFCGWLD